jgi:hypothetical protein
MKLEVPTNIYLRAAACAERAHYPTKVWCGMACEQHEYVGGVSVIASDDLGDVATTVATINGEWFPAHARRCIEAAVIKAEPLNALNPAWHTLGDSPRIVRLMSDSQKVCA